MAEWERGLTGRQAERRRPSVGRSVGRSVGSQRTEGNVGDGGSAESPTGKRRKEKEIVTGLAAEVESLMHADVNRIGREE